MQFFKLISIFCLFLSSLYAHNNTKLDQYNNLIKQIQTKSEKIKVNRINHFFNSFRFISDVKLNKKIDHWQSMNEFLSTEAGDCEDYSIAKFSALKSLGIDTDKLYILFGKNKKQKYHMVVAYYHDLKSEPYILDSQNRKVLPMSKRDDLTYMMAFNEKNSFKVNSNGNLAKADLPRFLKHKWSKITTQTIN